MVPEINLLPRSERKTSNRKWVFLIAGPIFLFLLTFLAIQYFSVTKDIKHLQAEQQALELQKTTLTEQLEVLEVPEVLDLATSVRFIESKTYAVSPLLKEIHDFTSAESYLRDFNFAETEIQFAVDMETISEVATYVGDLDGSSYFADIKVEDISTFDPVSKEEEEEETVDVFTEVERFANNFTVTIDPTYLLTGGGLR
ncbi:PilN domain-containing protein [Sporosarcina sp. CAU 1771]